MTPFGVAGFLYNPETREVLLHHRDGNTNIYPHKWAFFGGLGEGAETPVEAFVREMREELGITLDPTEVSLFCEHPAEIGGYRYAFFVRSDLAKAKMTLSEGADFDWISLDNVLTYDLTPRARLDLEMFSKSL